MYWDGLESLFEEKGHQRESQWMQWEKWKSRDSFRDLFAPEWMEKDNGTKVLASLETISSSLSKPRLFFCWWFSTHWNVAGATNSKKSTLKSSRTWVMIEQKIVFFFHPASTFTLSILDGKKREIKSSFVFFRFTSCRLFIFLLHHT